MEENLTTQPTLVSAVHNPMEHSDTQTLKTLRHSDTQTLSQSDYKPWRGLTFLGGVPLLYGGVLQQGQFAHHKNKWASNIKNSDVPLLNLAKVQVKQHISFGTVWYEIA